MTDDERLIQVVTQTANDIIELHGWFVHLNESQVKIVLDAFRLVKTAIERIEETNNTALTTKRRAKTFPY